MSWRSDELHHRSAERSGWAAELRAADPEAVDETVDGAVEYAAETAPSANRDEVASDQQAGVVDPTTVAGSATVADSDRRASAAVAEEAERDDPLEQADRRCAFCADPITAEGALDDAGIPFPEDSGFEWAGDVARYHSECTPDGEGRFLPWTANGVLGDEGAE